MVTIGVELIHVQIKHRQLARLFSSITNQTLEANSKLKHKFGKTIKSTFFVNSECGYRALIVRCNAVCTKRMGKVKLLLIYIS